MPETSLLRHSLLVALFVVGCTTANDEFARPVTDGGPDAARAPDAPGAADHSADTSTPTADAPLGEVPDGSASADAPSMTDSAVMPDVSPPVDGPPPADGPPPDAPTSGLVALWSFDELSGGRVGDLSGRANHGTAVGIANLATAWKAGKFAGAMEFPNQDGAAVSVAPSSSIDAVRLAFTISAWVNRKTDVGSRNAAIISRQLGDRNDDVYTFAFVSNALVLWLPRTSVRAPNPSPLNTWIHVAATWDGTIVRLYQDGVMVAFASYSLELPTTTNPVLLGNNANQSGLNQPFAGLLDEVRFYDRALSEAEVLLLARATGP